MNVKEEEEKPSRTNDFSTFLNIFSFYFLSDSMAGNAIQLVASKCPTDELSYTNCAVVNELDIDVKNIR